MIFKSICWIVFISEVVTISYIYFVNLQGFLAQPRHSPDHLCGGPGSHRQGNTIS